MASAHLPPPIPLKSPIRLTQQQCHDFREEAKYSFECDGSVNNSQLRANTACSLRSDRHHEDQPVQSKEISGKWKIILCHGTFATLPMMGLAAAMLCLVIPYNITLQNMQQYSSDSYLFLREIPIFVLLLLGSLCSILSLLLIPSLLKLSSFIYAQDILQRSEERELEDLPTTLDFVLLLRMLSGSPNAYFHALLRCFKTPFLEHRILRLAATISTVLMILSASITVCNISLHVTTRTIVVSERQFSELSVHDYGRALSPNCFTSSNDTNVSTFQTSLENDGCNGRWDLLIGGEEADRTARNKSTINRVVQLEFEGLKDFHNESVMILVDANAPPDSSFIASTYGVSSYFKDIGSECEINNTEYSWNCSDHDFSGVTTHLVTLPSSNNLRINRNVVMWVLAAKVTANNSIFNAFANSVDFEVSARNKSLLTVMHCETAVYEVEYFKNGNKYIAQAVKPVNDSIAQLVFSPVFPNMIEGYAGFDKDILQNQFDTITDESTTIEELAHRWAQSFASLAIASSVGIMIPAPIKENTPIITAVPKAPILILWAASLLYSVFALGLTFAAIRNVLARPGVRDVQARMGITGLVARALEPERQCMSVNSLEELFSERGKKSSEVDHLGRILVYKTPIGGWSWLVEKPEQRQVRLRQPVH